MPHYKQIPSSHHRVGVFFRPNEPAESCRQLLAVLLGRGLEVHVEESTVRRNVRLPEGVRMFSAQNIPELDWVLAFGGDGTLIGAARTMNGRHLPLWAVNRGSLGYLSDVTFDEFVPALDRVLRGEYTLDLRGKLRVSILREGQPLCKTQDVVNDVVVSNQLLGRLLTLRAAVNGEYLTDYRADGLIVCTPTGSTAYNLSAGGPIIEPGLSCAVLTPICPHTLSQRAMIVGAESRITLQLSAMERQAMVTLDGQVVESIKPRDEVQITASPTRMGLIRTSKRDKFQILRAKLRWGEGAVLGGEGEEG